MAKHAPALFAWLAWVLGFCSWVIMLGAVSALQKNCGNSAANASGLNVVHYLAPASCHKLYQYAWCTTWYQFVMMIVVPAVLTAGIVHKFRLGLIGLLIPVVMLLLQTANTFFQTYNVGFDVPVTGGLAARAKTMFAGALIGAFADFLLIILVGVHDEKLTYKL